MGRASDRHRAVPTSQALEQELHDALSLWAKEHAERYPDIGVLDYTPARAEQQIGTAKTSTTARLDSMPQAQLVSLLKRTYRTTMGAGAVTIASAVDDELGNTLRRFLRDGKSIAVLTSHAERLDDIGALSGAIALTLGEPALIRRNATILNKVMSRESYKGIRIASLFEYFASIYWVIPSTHSAARFGISAEVTRAVNGGSMRALVADLRTGIVLTFAPSGSAMRHNIQRDRGTVRLVIPPVAPATAKLVARFDAYVVATMWNGQLRLGPVTPIPRRGAADRMDVITDAMSVMAQLTSELAGIPVDYVASQ